MYVAIRLLNSGRSLQHLNTTLCAVKQLVCQGHNTLSGFASVLGVGVVCEALKFFQTDNTQWYQCRCWNEYRYHSNIGMAQNWPCVRTNNAAIVTNVNTIVYAFRKDFVRQTFLVQFSKLHVWCMLW